MHMLFILLAQIIEILCCVLDMPIWLYRLTACRYIFIIYLGYILYKKGFILNRKTILLGVVSMICICFFWYSHTNMRPLFYTGASAWRICHWVCYYYMCYFLLVLIKKIYEKFSYTKVSRYIEDMGKYSYEIFLFQMCYFVFGKRFISDYDTSFYRIVYILISLIICIVPIVFIKKHLICNINEKFKLWN